MHYVFYVPLCGERLGGWLKLIMNFYRVFIEKSKINGYKDWLFANALMICYVIALSHSVFR